MKMKNTSDKPVRLDDIGGGLVIPPGGTEEIPDEYAKPGRRANGARKPSIIEQLAPSLEPADDNEKTQWMQAPSEFNTVPARQSRPTPQQYMAQGKPEGVARLASQRALAIQQMEDVERRKQQLDAERQQHEQNAARLAAMEQQEAKKAEEQHKKDEEAAKKLASQGEKQLKDEEQFNTRMAAAVRQQRETGTTTPQEDRERQEQGQGGEEGGAPHRGRKH